MVGTNTKSTAAVETYFADLRRVQASGGATGELSSYGPLMGLLNSVGVTLKPKVFCVGQLADQGAGHPDFSLYTAKQVQKGCPHEGQAPERGVIKVKANYDNAWMTAAGELVCRYWGRYRLVLVTNCRAPTPTDDASAVRGHFEGARAQRFFRSTLVQMLFYGVFAAWVLWARQTPPPAGGFDWRTAVWRLRAPVLAALFQQLSQLGRLQPLGLVEVLDWTSAVLDRVDRAAFFSRFDEGAAVPYFYEPFLEAFDPDLRKQLGVWYTPSEVVRYMLAQADRALKDDLGIAEGLAAENVYTLDPCCGTGACLAEVLRRISNNLGGQGLGTLVGVRVKRETPVLVILGNPPYNGFAGLAVEEERELSEAYRSTKRVRRPERQGLNNLYIRFFGMAEWRVTEKTGQSMFSTEGDPVGIQVGTAVATLVRKADHAPAAAVGFWHMWGRSKHEDLLVTAEAPPGALYDDIVPVLSLGLPFVRTAVSVGWYDWPTLPELFPASFPGLKSGRDPFVVDIDIDRLKVRIADYFNPALSHEEISRRYPTAIRNPKQYDARVICNHLIENGEPEDFRFMPYAFRPFDNRWVDWEAREKLVGRPRPDYRPHVFGGNMWLSATQYLRRDATEPQTCFTRHMASLHLIECGALMFLAWLHEDTGRRPNLSNPACRYLTRSGLGVEDLFHHVLATLHDPAYQEANAGTLCMEWPRIPLPGWPDGGDEDSAAPLVRSAAAGSELAALLDPETLVQGVTTGALRSEIAAIAVPSTTDGRNMTGDNFALTAGWGHLGFNGVVMPGYGRAVERAFTPDERAALDGALPVLGETTYDVHLNDRAFWPNVPAAVWRYRLGGYQVLKKWLSYRERAVISRPLYPEEVQYFFDTARRISSVLLMSRITAVKA